MKSRNYEKNLKILEALFGAGSDPNKIHSIEHHYYCNTEKDYEMLMELGRIAGYEIKHEGFTESEDGNFWQMDLVKPIKPSIEAIEIQSLEMERFAQQTNSEYDGWGTEVEV